MGVELISPRQLAGTDSPDIFYGMSGIEKLFPYADIDSIDLIGPVNKPGTSDAGQSSQYTPMTLTDRLHSTSLRFRKTSSGSKSLWGVW